MSAANNLVTRQEIEQCQDIVRNFKVHELHQLLSVYRYPKLGKKQDLVNRALSILINPKFQLSAVQKVRELQTSGRLRDASQPYAATTSSGAAVQATMPNGVPNSMNHQQQPPPNTYNFNFPPQPGAAVPLSSRSGGYSGQQPNFNNLMQAYAANAAVAYHQQFGVPMPNFSHSIPTSHGVQQQQGHTHLMPIQPTGQAKNLRTIELPFYDQLKVIYPMTELPSYAVPTRPGEGRYSCSFGVPPEDMAKVQYRSEETPIPRYELQLRVFLLETSQVQEDAFPPGSVVKLDDICVQLPQIIPTNKPNAEQKRYSRPVNITPYCQPPRSTGRPHRLQFEWNGDKRAWAFTVTLVRRLNSDILLDRIMKNPNAKRPFDKTKNMIMRRLGGEDEDGIETDSVQVSLIDPLMRTRVKIPARGVDCTHWNCFDLNNYLRMEERRPTWKCPLCHGNAIYSRLIIEDYFVQLLSSVGPGVDEVELRRDGTWGLPKAAEAIALDDSDNEGEEIMVVTGGKGEKKKERPATEQRQAEAQSSSSGGHAQQQSVAAPKRSNAPPPEPDVICLSSDDEDEQEEQQLRDAIAASCMDGGVSSSHSGTPNSASGGSTAATPIMASVSLNGGGSSSERGGHNHQQQPNGNGTTQHLQHNGHIATNGPAAGAAAPLESHHEGGQLPIFRPIMDEVAKTQIAHNLAMFLQGVYSKNNMPS